MTIYELLIRQAAEDLRPLLKEDGSFGIVADISKEALINLIVATGTPYMGDVQAQRVEEDLVREIHG